MHIKLLRKETKVKSISSGPCSRDGDWKQLSLSLLLALEEEEEEGFLSSLSWNRRETTACWAGALSDPHSPGMQYWWAPFLEEG